MSKDNIIAWLTLLLVSVGVICAVGNTVNNIGARRQRHQVYLDIKPMIDQMDNQYGGYLYASWYGRWHQGRIMANGRPYNMHRLTAAHRALPFGTIIAVCHKLHYCEMEITDRGPFVDGRGLDLSWAAAESLGLVNVGVALVEMHVIGANLKGFGVVKYETEQIQWGKKYEQEGHP